MIRKLKSGYTWEYSDEEKVLFLYHENKGEEEGVILIPRSKIRSLGCFINQIAWHKDIKKSNDKTK